MGDPLCAIDIFYAVDVNERAVCCLGGCLPNVPIRLYCMGEGWTPPTDLSENHMLIIIGHCAITIADDGSVSYMAGYGDNVNSCITVSKARYSYVWLAGCFSANADVANNMNLYSYQEICDASDARVSLRHKTLLRSFLIDGAGTELTISWICAFLQMMRQCNCCWWAVGNLLKCDHPIRMLARYDPHREELIKGEIETIAASVSNDFRHAGIPDDVLYPYHFSFPEMFHCASMCAVLGTPQCVLEVIENDPGLLTKLQTAAENHKQQCGVILGDHILNAIKEGNHTSLASIAAELVASCEDQLLVAIVDDKASTLSGMKSACDEYVKMHNSAGSNSAGAKSADADRQMAQGAKAVFNSKDLNSLDGRFVNACNEWLSLFEVLTKFLFYQRNRFVDPVMAKHGNEWFKRICESSGGLSTENDMKNLKKLIEAFKAGHFPNLHTPFDKLIKKAKIDYPARSEMLKRFLQVSELYPTPAGRQGSVAVVFRKSDHGVDWRASSKNEDYRNFFNEFMAEASKAGVYLVLLDAVIENIDLPKNNYIDLREHWNTNNRQLACPYKKCLDNNILDQVRYLHAVVQEYNIQGAVGVHSGLLDVLNAFGVPPARTLRFFGSTCAAAEEYEYTKLKEHWKKRTDSLLKRFGITESCQWRDNIPEVQPAVALFNKSSLN
jgi:hypothetical protein